MDYTGSVLGLFAKSESKQCLKILLNHFLMGRDFPFFHTTGQLQVKDSQHASIMRDAYAKVKRNCLVCVWSVEGGGSTIEMNIKVFLNAFQFFQWETMEGSTCSFLAIVGGHCGYDSKDRTKSVEIVPLLTCRRDISGHKSAFSIIGIEDEVELLLARATIFAPPRNIENWTICPQHRASLGVSWKRSSTKCVIPVSLSRHSTTTTKKPKAERGLSKLGSQFVMKETGIFLPVGTGESVCF